MYQVTFQAPPACHHRVAGRSLQRAEADGDDFQPRREKLSRLGAPTVGPENV